MMMPRLIPMLLLAALLLPAKAGAAPAQVLLLRHGDKDVQRGDYNLSPQGFERAMRLGGMIPACFGTPSYIGVFEFDPVSTKNGRSYQTAVPLAVATGLRINMIQGSRDNSFSVGQQLLKDKAFEGSKAVLIWEHRRLPDLAKGLGWGAMAPIAADDFDQLIVLTWPSAAAPPRVQRFSQADLFQQPCAQKALSAVATAIGTPVDGGLSLDLPALLAATGQPPQSSDPQASSDRAILQWLQEHRSPQLIANSWLMLDRTLSNFDLALGVDMTKSTPQLLRGLAPFLALVDGAKDTIKDIYKRPRPYVADANLHPCLPKESGWSFPSGHSAYFRAAAELLADLLPERRERLLVVGHSGGTSRTMCGVHYPSDVEAGQRLGEAAARQIIASEQWRRFKTNAAIQAELGKLRAVKVQHLQLDIN